ncbi:MAG: hypothetical protein GTO18_04010 [Anaerolineales bacterium]|nr:hypothetical protein [Anaerolineales bacterium]
MTRMHQYRKRDIEKLSAYLDGELSPKETARLEEHLRENPGLRRLYEELGATRNLLAELPTVRPPKNFTLTPEMAGIRWRRNAYPVFRLATMAAVVALVVVIGADALTRTRFPAATTAFDAPQAVMERGALEELAEEGVVEIVPEAEAEVAEPLAGAALEEGELAEQPLAEVGENATMDFLGEPAEAPEEEKAGEDREACQACTPAPTGTTEVAEGIGDADEPTPEAVEEPPLPLAPTVISEGQSDVFDLGPLQIAELSLGIAVLVLLGGTLYFRRFR